MPFYDNGNFTESVTKTMLITQYESRQSYPDEVTQRYINISCAILEQAVDDWKYLQLYGLDSAEYLAAKIRRDELLNFFYGEWFETLLEYALPGIDPDDVRVTLKIGKYARKEQ